MVEPTSFKKLQSVKNQVNFKFNLTEEKRIDELDMFHGKKLAYYLFIHSIKNN